MKLYYHAVSGFSRRVRIAIIEKSLQVDLVEVDLFARRQKQPEYLSLNPYGRVPTLVDGDLVLYESTAILEYLEAVFPKPALLPENPRDRALVSMHTKLCDLQFSRQAGTILLPKRFRPREQWDLEAISRAADEIRQHFPILESQLEGREYLVAERFTLADICYLPYVQFLPLMEITPGPWTARWVERLLNRDSAAQTRPPR